VDEESRGCWRLAAWQRTSTPSHASQGVAAMEISALLPLCGRWLGGGNWASTLLSFLRQLAPGPPLILKVYQLMGGASIPVVSLK
jgi:hypothetical protein